MAFSSFAGHWSRVGGANIYTYAYRNSYRDAYGYGYVYHNCDSDLNADGDGAEAFADAQTASCNTGAAVLTGKADS